MQTIQNATCLELPALESRDERRFTGVSSIFFNDSSLAIPSRLATKGSAVISERLPETTCRISGWEDWTQGLEAVHSHYVLPDPVTHTELFLCLLDDCIIKKDVAIGRALHALVTNNGLELESFFCVHLIRMFSSLNLLVEADRIFSKLVQPNVFAWTAIISAHTKSTESCHAIRLCHEMLNTRVELDTSISVVILKACATSDALVEGERTHAHVLELGLESDSFVSSALVNMYSKCGQLLQAHLIFSRAGQPNLETWNSLIAGYVHHGHCEEALWLYDKMREGGLEPDKITFLSAVKACSRMSALEEELSGLEYSNWRKY